MRTITFKSYTQYEEFMKRKFVHKAKRKGIEGEELNNHLKNYEHHIQEVWIENEGDKAIEEQGSVTISFHRKRGTHKHGGKKHFLKEEKGNLNHSIHVRLDENTYDALLNFCSKHKMDISQAIRFFIKNNTGKTS
ncbi:hypothetical protein HPB58_13225 [Priestia filamentosa]|uniref:hypothetical protein n=1 Tax=Priestia filamentosa TaxID=1402861 RepID=UPI001FB4012A|nr:hypothetical protein [Priestia filamentosa]MED3727585.1 hypothetical protein [Priestia filamentosa]UOE58311.1 hypothetical protein HPB58_13225 [Priestia filamentosa]